uniref:Uncharacterized protein n=1 Tax=Rhizophora mucronata TaxID=61149 RepID=A0A2P2NHE8_RHIMU
MVPEGQGSRPFQPKNEQSCHSN